MEPWKSVSVIVSDARGRILLHKREDFRIWSLPGGRLEPGESWERAAVREAEEETGYQIAVERFVGEYSQPQMPNGGQLKYVCTGRVVGGQAVQRAAETVRVEWFAADSLPYSLPRFMRIYIEDALAAHDGPFRKTLRMPRAKAFAIKVLIGIRNLRNRLPGRGRG